MQIIICDASPNTSDFSPILNPTKEKIASNKIKIINSNVKFVEKINKNTTNHFNEINIESLLLELNKLNPNEQQQILILSTELVDEVDREKHLNKSQNLKDKLIDFGVSVASNLTSEGLLKLAIALVN